MTAAGQGPSYMPLQGSLAGVMKPSFLCKAAIFYPNYHPDGVKHQQSVVNVLAVEAISLPHRQENSSLEQSDKAAPLAVQCIVPRVVFLDGLTCGCTLIRVRPCEEQSNIIPDYLSC